MQNETTISKLSNTDMAYFSDTKLSNISHFFRISDVSVNWTLYCK